MAIWRYKVLERLIYEGKIVKVTVDKLQMPDGKAAYRETVIRGKNAAAALAVDAEGKIIFVRQYRHAFKEMHGNFLQGGWKKVRNLMKASNVKSAEEQVICRKYVEFICELYPVGAGYREDLSCILV